MGIPRTAQRKKSLVKATGVCPILIEATMLSLTATQVLPDFQIFFAVFQRAWTEMTLQKTIFNWKQLFRMNGQVNQVQILICGFKSFFLKL